MGSGADLTKLVNESEQERIEMAISCFAYLSMRAEGAEHINLKMQSARYVLLQKAAA